MVLNIRPKSLGSVSSPPHSGHFVPSTWSALNLALHFLQSTRGSWKLSTWPEALQTSGWVMMAVSTPTTSARRLTMKSHQLDSMFFLSSTPSGP